MCGIAGFIHLANGRDVSMSRILAMLNFIYHRGPDDGGVWIDELRGVALGHRRLSILDLSKAGRQPMESVCGRFVIVFNGEIYNHLELRERLTTSNQIPIGGWRGHSDTETLLACFAAWGIEKTLQSTVGMFALALWDKYESTLFLARDRIGEKPLYYGWQKDAFLFGSELKSLRAHPYFESKMDWNAASSYFRWNYIPAPSSIYKGILKLIPGTYVKLTPKHLQSKKIPSPIAYWSLEDRVKLGAENPFKGNFIDAVNELELLVRQAVQSQSVADVPIGAFLSGGIDSSTVVAMMRLSTASKISTFSIGMTDPKMDESKHAASVAKHFDTNHVEHIMQPHEALELIPKLSEIWDEPFADSSQIPTYLVSKLAKQTVTVALSGDGGDEFFLGYPQYKLYDKIWRTRLLGRLPWGIINKATNSLVASGRVKTLSRRANSIASAWSQPNPQALNRYWMDRYRNTNVPITEQKSSTMLCLPILADASTTAGIWDAGTYLPDDIMVKVDRASMANSLETRSPLLDHRIIEFAYRLPVEYKIDSVNKKVLREVLYRHIPKSLVDRPKMGFSMPLSSWLKDELREWAEDLLKEVPHYSEYMNKTMINELWKEHQTGQCDNTEKLWGILTFINFIKNNKLIL